MDDGIVTIYCKAMRTLMDEIKLNIIMKLCKIYYNTTLETLYNNSDMNKLIAIDEAWYMHIQKYINENITSSMQTYPVIKKVCKDLVEVFMYENKLRIKLIQPKENLEC